MTAIVVKLQWIAIEEFNYLLSFYEIHSIAKGNDAYKYYSTVSARLLNCGLRSPATPFSSKHANIRPLAHEQTPPQKSRILWVSVDWLHKTINDGLCSLGHSLYKSTVYLKERAWVEVSGWKSEMSLALVWAHLRLCLPTWSRVLSLCSLSSRVPTGRSLAACSSSFQSGVYAHTITHSDKIEISSSESNK